VTGVEVVIEIFSPSLWHRYGDMAPQR